MRRCGNDVWDTRPREGGKLAAWYLPSQRKAKKGTLLHGIHQRSAFSTGVLVKKTTGPDRFLRGYEAKQNSQTSQGKQATKMST